MTEMERRAPSPAHFAVSLGCATSHSHAISHPPPWGLCKRQNYPMLNLAADPDGSLEWRRESMWEIRRA